MNKKFFILSLTIPLVIGIHFAFQKINQPQKGVSNPMLFPSPVNYSWNHNVQAEKLVGRHKPPSGFKLTKVQDGSFAHWLRNLPMMPKGTPIKLYNGKKKLLQALNAGVLDIDVGKTDLQQCADAVIRLRAEYLYAKKDYNRINFNYTSGFKASYSKWREGYKIGVKGNDAYYYKKPKDNDKDYSGFRKYLWNVYNYAGTYSLNKELIKQSTNKIKEGDVLIIGGFPGHVVMVAAVAENDKKEKAVLLIQSYMPAQNIHIVKKQLTGGDKIWFKVEDLKKNGWKTWEFDYTQEHLKTWNN